MLGGIGVDLIVAGILAHQGELARQVVVGHDGCRNRRIVLERGACGDDLFLAVDPAHADRRIGGLQLRDRVQHFGMGVELGGIAIAVGARAGHNEGVSIGHVAVDVDTDEGHAVDRTLRVDRIRRRGVRRHRDDGCNRECTGDGVQFHEVNLQFALSLLRATAPGRMSG